MPLSDTTVSLHPYYPVGIALSGDIFIANDWSVTTLVSAFAGGLALMLGVTLLLVKKVNPNLKGSDQGLVLWFVLSRSIVLNFIATTLTSLSGIHTSVF